MTNQETIEIIRDIDKAYRTFTKTEIQALEMAIKALEIEPNEDAVSRQAVLDLIADYDLSMGQVVKGIHALPSVTPQEPKTGHWIQTNEFFINQDGQFIYNFICSECKSLSYFRKSNKKAIGANVCPNCGVKMVEPQERSKE